MKSLLLKGIEKPITLLSTASVLHFFDVHEIIILIWKKVTQSTSEELNHIFYLLGVYSMN